MSVRIVEKKLQRHRSKGEKFVYGQADEKKEIAEVDPRQDEEEGLDSRVHETVHIAAPWLKESTVKKISDAVCTALWGEGWRRVRLQ